MINPTSLMYKPLVATLYYLLNAVFWLCFSNASMAVEMPKASQWQGDIDVYVEQLEQKHIHLFHSISKKAFDKDVEQLKAQLHTLSESQILVRLMRLTNSIGDGHSSFPLWGGIAHKFPIRLRAINRKLYVEQATNAYQSLLGSELIAIDGVAIGIVIEALSKIVPFAENPYSTLVRVAQYMTIAEVLNGEGFINENYSSEFSFKKEAHLIKETLTAAEKQSFQFTLSIDNPVSEHKVQEVNESLWFSSSYDKKSVYVKFERYADLQTMDSFSHALLDFIELNQSKSVILDLRNNYGGDFFSGLKIAQYLVRADSLNWRNGIFTLINNKTFSAAMSNAAQFKQLLNAELVGEPTGAKPSGYQDMGEFVLPHSKRVVTYSKRMYKFLDTEDDAIYPDVSIEMTIGDYKTNNDKQLEYVLEKVEWRRQKF